MRPLLTAMALLTLVALYFNSKSQNETLERRDSNPNSRPSTVESWSYDSSSKPENDSIQKVKKDDLDSAVALNSIVSTAEKDESLVGKNKTVDQPPQKSGAENSQTEEVNPMQSEQGKPVASHFKRKSEIIDKERLRGVLMKTQTPAQVERTLSRLPVSISTIEAMPGEARLKFNEVPKPNCSQSSPFNHDLALRVDTDGMITHAEWREPNISAPIPEFLQTCRFPTYLHDGRPSPFVFIWPHIDSFTLTN